MQTLARIIGAQALPVITGYIDPQHFGISLDDKEAAWASYLEWTKLLMKPMHLESVRTVAGGDDVIERYVKALPDCHSIFADMGRYSGRRSISNLTYMLHDKPVFRAVTGWTYGKQGFLKEIHDQVGSQRP